MAIEELSTRGDEVLDRSLAELGGKGLFVKTLEAAMLDGRADAAVHSAKDMETDFAAGTVIAAFLEREDRRDALIGQYSRIEELPDGAVVGTASVRRAAILGSIRPDLQLRLLRGNVNSRLRQLEDGQYDAIILAMAGMNRLGFSADIHPLDEETMLPAAAQGAIAIQALGPDGSARRAAILESLEALNHPATAAKSGPSAPSWPNLTAPAGHQSAASARFGTSLEMKAALYSPDGRQAFFAEGSASPADAESLGTRLAAALLDQAGGRGFLAAEAQPS